MSFLFHQSTYVISNFAKQLTVIFAYLRFMSTGFKMSNVWSMTSYDFKNASTDGFFETRNFNESSSFMMDKNTNQRMNNPDKCQIQIFTCNICGNKYTWISSLRRHQLQCGNKEAKNECEFCSKKFYRRDSLKEHLLVHHSNVATD